MAREQPDTAVKVAVIGTGYVSLLASLRVVLNPSQSSLAGLTTAHLLQTLPFEAKDGSKVKFQVHIFDKVCTEEAPSREESELTGDFLRRAKRLGWIPRR